MSRVNAIMIILNLEISDVLPFFYIFELRWIFGVGTPLRILFVEAQPPHSTISAIITTLLWKGGIAL